MKKLLVYILALGTISGIIPIFTLYLMEKSVLFTVLMVIAAIGLLFKELCF